MRDAWEALRLVDEHGPLERVLLPASLSEPVGAGEDGAPGVVAYVLNTTHLDAFAATGDGRRFSDRGTKHAERSLAMCFGERGGQLRLRADYREPGQAERGLRALLKRAGRLGRAACYLVGVPEAVFDVLRHRSVASPMDPVRGTTSADGDAAVDAGELHYLLSRLDDLEVDPRLAERYCGASAAVDLVRRLAMVAARSRDPVLIQGETGTGKELVARAIHDAGPRRAQAFVAVNCSAIPPELFESEVFGHRRGSFTGAVADKPGFWAAAEGGTLFLDEIGDLGSEHQAKMLRALESGRYRPVGATAEIAGDARVLAATHHDLEAMVESGRFREDLYYRLFHFRIVTPPLREHPGDIPAIAASLWRKVSGDAGAVLPAEALEELKTYAWPGNARELRAFLANLRAFAGSKPVDARLVRAVFRVRQANPQRRCVDGRPHRTSRSLP